MAAEVAMPGPWECAVALVVVLLLTVAWEQDLVRRGLWVGRRR